MISNAVGSELLSKVLGYQLTGGDFSTTSPNLPMRIVIIGEANSANQGDLDTAATAITSAQKAGELYGYGSPIHRVMSILRPQSGSGVGGIPTIVYAQEEAGSSDAAVLKITPTGTATASGTHTIKLSGRTGIDGYAYDFNILVGDTAADIYAKMTDAVNAVLGSPAIATNDTGTVLTAKWNGLSSNDMNVEVLTNDLDLGITYAVTSVTSGSGTPSIASALAAFGNEWNTIVINTYGLVSSVMDALEAYNGIPDPASGRYSGIIFKPLIALCGSVDEDPSSVTDSRSTQVTLAVCPAPFSQGFPFEAAANVARLFARKAQDTPELDVMSDAYPDMPTPSYIGSMADYLTRDAISKKGCSTVDLISGQYVMMDFVTTYHPVGENPPQYKYCRNLVLDWNIAFSIYLLEQKHVVDHVITSDDTLVTTLKVIKPKRWKSIMKNAAVEFGKRSLIADVPFMQNSIIVGIGISNPDRLETFFRYKRTGVARIVSTTAEAGFNFGQ